MNAQSSFLKGGISSNAAYGLVLLFALLAIVIAGTVREKVLQTRTNAEYAGRELAKLNSIDNSDLWAKRADKSQKALKQWQASVWEGETVGVLAAKIQQRLIVLASDMGLENSQITVGNELINIDGQTVMRFSLTGTSSGNAKPIEILLAIAKNQKTLIVDEITADFYQGQRSLVRLSGLAIVNLGRSGAKQGANP